MGLGAGNLHIFFLPENTRLHLLLKIKKGNTGTTTLDFTVDEKGESKVTQVTQEETGEVIEKETIVVKVKNFFEKIIESVKSLFSHN